MPDFSKRCTEDELMDDFALSREIIDPIMDELEVINLRLGGYSVFFNAFKKIGLKDQYSISDWGCGGGDSLRQIAIWAKRKSINLQLSGLDATPAAIDYARRKAVARPEISFELANVLTDDIQPNQYDVIISSLFTHHFRDADWINLIKKMVASAKKAVVVNDLHRHWFAYYSIGFLTGLFSKSYMVKNDSKISVLRSFKKSELTSLLAEAGISNYQLRWMWAFRWQLIIYK
ncbi:methyltransferase domain-containing protein [Pedobacter sp. HMF7647]|uniref:Methyltransferase domain-containing protein n=1 Tax=Hufsiella arboris TaxID=2695275 RepID=A0A7K1Y6A5_9SPHI|nr:methyltransferase domain-containing protein [Hufsiella arboris]MXV49568.1 methyltransferase domain-containing protein [Hufsiella arboris]